MFGLSKTKEMQKEIDELRQELDARNPFEYDVSTQAMTTNEYYNIYSTNGLMKIIVSDPAERVTSKGFFLDVKSDDLDYVDELNEALKQDYKKWCLAEKRRDLIKWSRLYPEGSGILPIIETKNDSRGIAAARSLKEPMPPKIKDIKTWNVLNDPDDFTISTVNTSDPSREDYNQPFYSVGGQMTHGTRFCNLINDFKADMQKGVSVVDLVKDAITAQDNAINGNAQIMARIGAILYRSPENQVGTRKTKKYLVEKLGIIKERLKSDGIMALLSDDSAELLNFNFGDLSNVYESIIDNVSINSGIPKRVLLQQSQGGIISGDGANADERNYFAKLESFQSNDLRRVDEFIIDTLLKTESSKLYQAVSGPIEYEISYNSLWSMDEKAKADVRKTNAESDKIDFEVGKADGDELRQLDDRYA